jgi:hypothetical protein
MPKRIQRKRTKGWKMPATAVYVGRPSLYGNPYPASIYGLDLSLKLFRNTANGVWNAAMLPGGYKYEIAEKQHCAWLRRFGNHHPQESIRTYLRGVDLACWCPLDQPCHADVLLEIANAL